MVDYQQITIIGKTNNEKVALNSEEQAIKDADEKYLIDNKTSLQIAEIRQIRNEKLSETDYLAMSDNIISDEMKAFRKSMRDIPQDYSADKYDELLARNDKGELTHSVWSKP